jgi:predicted transcriptional regulator
MKKKENTVIIKRVVRSTSPRLANDTNNLQGLSSLRSFDTSGFTREQIVYISKFFKHFKQYQKEIFDFRKNIFLNEKAVLTLLHDKSFEHLKNEYGLNLRGFRILVLIYMLSNIYKPEEVKKTLIDDTYCNLYKIKITYIHKGLTWLRKHGFIDLKKLYHPGSGRPVRWFLTSRGYEVIRRYNAIISYYTEDMFEILHSHK